MSQSERSLIVDIDGTLCPIKASGDTYESLVPYSDIIESLREYQAEGFRIVLYTARNMRTHDGNLGLINKFTAPVLLKWLDHWQVPYDEILFGKPWPGSDGFYLDDRSVRPGEFLTHDHQGLLDIIERDRQQAKALREGQGEDLNIVITMAGLGSRFKKAGYTVEKYEIEVHEKTLFEWSLKSLEGFMSPRSRVIFVTLQATESGPFIERMCSHLGIKKWKVVELPSLTDGQATSAMAAKPYWTPDAPLLVYNIDTFVQPEALVPASIPAGADGWIPCFRADGDHWSFVDVGEDGRATDVAEKRRISENATIGLYWFKSAMLYAQYYGTHFAAPDGEEAGEKYIAPMYRSMIADGLGIYISDVPTSSVHCLGTPDEVDQFKHSKIS